MGFLISALAKTRLRLILSNLLIAGAVFGSSPWAANFIRHASRSPTADMLMIVIWLIVCFLLSYLEAILVGDLVFGQAWRERNILSKTPKLPSVDDDDDVGFLRSEIKDRTLHFSVIIVLCMLLNGWGANLVNDNFWGYYTEEGSIITRLRSPKPAYRVRAIIKITKVPDQRIVRLMPHVLRLADDDPHPEVRRTALWAIGIYADRMVRSILILQDKEPREYRKRWETQTYFNEILDKYLPRIDLAIKRRKGLERQAAILALGRIRDKKALMTLFSQELNKGESKLVTDDLRAMIVALTFARYEEGLDLILRIMSRGQQDNSVILYGVWALGEIAQFGKPKADKLPPQAIRRSVIFLKDVFFKLSLDQQCAALDALAKIRDPLVIPTIIKAFRKSQPRMRCPRMVLKRREMAPLLMILRENFRMKALRVLMKMVTREVVSFAKEVASERDPNGDYLYSAEVRGRAQSIVQQYEKFKKQ